VLFYCHYKPHIKHYKRTILMRQSLIQMRNILLLWDLWYTNINIYWVPFVNNCYCRSARPGYTEKNMGKFCENLYFSQMRIFIIKRGKIFSRLRIKKSLFENSTDWFSSFLMILASVLSCLSFECDWSPGLLVTVVVVP